MAIVQIQIAPDSNLPTIHDNQTLTLPEFAPFRDERSYFTQVTHLAGSLIKDLKFIIRFRSDGVNLESRIGKKVFWHPTEPGVFDWNQDSTGAAFFIHGIHGVPYIWNDHLEKIASDHPKMDLRAFYVRNQNDCSVDQSMPEIVKVIRSYHEKHPRRPIAIYGVSNGARGVLHAVKDLEDLKTTPMFIQSIAGPHHGSYMMNFLSSLYLTGMFSQESVDELKLHNEKSKAIIDYHRNQAYNPLRTFHFYATECDTTVRSSLLGNISTVSLPIINKKETHILLKGDMMAAHSNIVEEVCPMQLKAMKEWLGNIAI